MAKGKMKGNLQLLLDQKAKLLAEMEALKNKIAGLDMAISLLKSDAISPLSVAKVQAGLKAVILDLLKEAGATGLNANSAVEMAEKKGMTLNRGSVASNLSRLSKEKAISYDGDRYRLPEFAKGPTLVKAPWS